MVPRSASSVGERADLERTVKARQLPATRRGTVAGGEQLARQSHAHDLASPCLSIDVKKSPDWRLTRVWAARARTLLLSRTAEPTTAENIDVLRWQGGVGR
jgi:hypothetical protein